MIHVLEAVARRVMCRDLCVSVFISLASYQLTTCSFLQECPVLLLSFPFRVLVGVNHYFWNILVDSF